MKKWLTAESVLVVSTLTLSAHENSGSATQNSMVLQNIHRHLSSCNPSGGALTTYGPFYYL
ncbi:MAG: hypothetical protein NTX05_02325 [Fusobacteria bacterium]|nr:hypothetical protein [Fusobacteriota bacterium]